MTAFVKSFMDAYNALLLDGARNDMGVDCISVDDVVNVSDAAMQQAVTMNKWLEDLGYTLDVSSLLTYAVYCQYTEANGGRVYRLDEALRGYLPKSEGTPLISGFPEEVMAMSEAKYRFIQLFHYCSVFLPEFLGFDPVPGGWRPESDFDVEKSEEQEKNSLGLKVLYLYLDTPRGYNSLDTLGNCFYRDLEAPIRMSPAKVQAAAEYIHMTTRDGGELPYMPRVGFKENGAGLVRALTENCRGGWDEGYSRALSCILGKTCFNPMDVLKDILVVRDIMRVGGKMPSPEVSRNSLPTSVKRVFSRMLDVYEPWFLGQNLADAKDDVRFAVTYISYKRFSRKPENVAAVHDALYGKIKSFGSKVEEAFVRTYVDEEDEARLGWAVDELSKRPGMLLRSVNRVYNRAVELWGPEGKRKAWDMLYDAFGKDKTGIPRATLVRVLTELSSMDTGMYGAAKFIGKVDAGNLRGGDGEIALLRSVFRNIAFNGTIDVPKEFSDADGVAHHDGRRVKVYVDDTGFSEKGSVVLPSVVGEGTENSYPPVGMAYALPVERLAGRGGENDKGGVLRAFLFWKDENTRVDLDLHVWGRAGIERADSTTSYRNVHFGWNGDFHDDGVVVSGDITESHIPAEEYIDLYRGDGVDDFVMTVVHYSGSDWYDSPNLEACVGALWKDSSKAADALFDVKNAIFSDRLVGDSNGDYLAAYVNAKDGYLRIMRNARCAGEYGYTLKNYLDDLITCGWGAERVDSEDEADVVLTVGRRAKESADADGKPEVCLSDNNLFLND